MARIPSLRSEGWRRKLAFRRPHDALLETEEQTFSVRLSRQLRAALFLTAFVGVERLCLFSVLFLYFRIRFLDHTANFLVPRSCCK